MLRRASCYRPADPVTPRGELVKEINSVLEEEGKRIGMSLRAVETGGLSLARQLVKPDLKAGEPCGRQGCVLCLMGGGAGAPHNCPFALYMGNSKLYEAGGERGSTGGRQEDLGFTEPNNTRVRWPGETSILPSFTLKVRGISLTLTHR